MRAVKASRRQRSGLPVVALVGYTNAGKSSLLNRLTGSHVLVEDRLFATLDATLRRLDPADEHLALIGKGQFRPRLGRGLRDAPGDRAVVRDPHDQAALTLQQSAHAGYPLKLLNTRLALVPPKPKLFERTESISTPKRASVAISPGRMAGSSVVTLAEAAI